MQLFDLVKPLDKMSDEELMEHVRAMRHRRDSRRPVAVKKAARTEKKASQKKVSGVEKLLAGLSEAERNALIESLSQGE